MVHFEKSQPAPECLAIEKDKKNGNYNCGNVLERLQQDFKNKCYLCEDTDITNIEIEHFKPKSNFPHLIFEWGNLFFSCGYCNSVKSNDFHDILDCTNKEHNVDKNITYQIKIEQDLKEKISIKSIKTNDVTTQNTVTLLLEIHQPENSTLNKKIASQNLRTKILENVNNFINYIEKYVEAKNENDNTKIQTIKIIIQKELSNSSKFTAFKRWIIAENKEICDDFIQLLE
ncbi:MAG: hypothetical protein EAZ85_14490 [Bacteroidetes bacterium]|nr:MAG: hypothetical protein EAZ85_14490 [Bacteroidota bacterium]